MNEQYFDELAHFIEQSWDNLRWNIVIVILIYTLVRILFFIAAANYQAIKNAEAFDYDKLAKKIAKELKNTQTPQNQE